MKNKTLWTVIGFLLAGTSILSFILSLMGLDIVIFAWMHQLGSLPAFLIKIGLILMGFVIIYVSKTDFDKDEII